MSDTNNNSSSAASSSAATASATTKKPEAEEEIPGRVELKFPYHDKEGNEISVLTPKNEITTGDIEDRGFPEKMFDPAVMKLTAYYYAIGRNTLRKLKPVDSMALQEAMLKHGIGDLGN